MGLRELPGRQLLYMTPGEYPLLGALLIGFAAIDDILCQTSGWIGLRNAFLKQHQVGEKIGADGSAGFDFNSCKPLPLIDQQVDFRPPGFPIVEQIGRQPAMREDFVDFGDHPGFENGFPQRMQTELFRLPDTQKIAHEARVEKTQFGRLDLLFAQVDMPGRQPMDDIAGFENRNLGTRRIVRYSCVASELGQVDFLGRTAGAKP